MNKAKLFIESIFIYGLGGAMSMIIPVIMVPIVTRLMPNISDYGINDLANTLVTFSRSFAIMGMYDAMYRIFFEKDTLDFKKTICSTALTCTMVLSILSFFILMFFKEQFSILLFNEDKYSFIIAIVAFSTLTGATNTIVSAPTRMQNKRVIYLITNTLAPIISYSMAIPMIIAGYTVVALPLSNAVSGIIMEAVFLYLNHEWFSLKLFNIDELKELLKIGIPIMPSIIFYWVFNSCDRLMITHYLGTSASGIYAVGAKLGMASQLIYIAFAGGWQYFAFSTMKDINQVKSNSLVFEYLGVISLNAGIIMCVLSKPIYCLLFSGEYIEGYIVAPYLFLAPLMQMLFQIAGNQFLVIKKTLPSMIILMTGAILNFVMNSVLIPIFGIEGAALSTLAGYVFCVVIVSIVTVKMRLMVISGRFKVIVILSAIAMLICRLYDSQVYMSLLMLFGIMVVTFCLYKEDIVKLLYRIKKE